MTDDEKDIYDIQTLEGCGLPYHIYPFHLLNTNPLKRREDDKFTLNVTRKF